MKILYDNHNLLQRTGIVEYEAEHTHIVDGIKNSELGKGGKAI